MRKDIIDHVASIFEKEGADAWYIRKPSELLPQDTVCDKCGKDDFKTEFDILDVWFDSGSSHLATLGKREDLPWPSDLYIEGGDQYRGWFQSSLLIAVALHGKAPYGTAITHGWTLDEQGRTMSKSKGIGIDPNDLVKARGADIARLLVSSVNYVEDVRIFDELLDRLGEAYRKIRNTCRFMLGNISDFNPENDRVALESMEEIDRFALHRLCELLEKAKKAYDRYEFHTIYHSLYNYCTVDLSSFYLDILKDRLYTSPPMSMARRSAQTVMYILLDAVAKIMAPILPFTSEEIWKFMPDSESKEESIHLSMFSEPDPAWQDNALSEKWGKLLHVRGEVTRALELARAKKLIGHPLDAEVVISADDDLLSFLSSYEQELRRIFIVSKTTLNKELPEGSEPFSSEEIDIGRFLEAHIHGF